MQPAASRCRPSPPPAALASPQRARGAPFGRFSASHVAPWPVLAAGARAGAPERRIARAGPRRAAVRAARRARAGARRVRGPRHGAGASVAASPRSDCCCLGHARTARHTRGATRAAAVICRRDAVARAPGGRGRPRPGRGAFSAQHHEVELTRGADARRLAARRRSWRRPAGGTPPRPPTWCACAPCASCTPSCARCGALFGGASRAIARPRAERRPRRACARARRPRAPGWRLACSSGTMRAAARAGQGWSRRHETSTERVARRPQANRGGRSRLVAVSFSATHCGSCRALFPKVRRRDGNSHPPRTFCASR